MPLGVSLQLFDGATAQASLSGIQALWWDSTAEPKNLDAPDGRSDAVTTDASGNISLDLSVVSGLSAGAYGFLMLYKLNATDHKDSLVFAGKVQTSTVTSGVVLQIPNGWTRNPSWLALPSVADTENKIVGLYRINKASNFIALNCAGAYTVDWGDGSAPENFATGVSAYHEYDWADTDLDGTNAPVTLTDTGDLVGRTAHGYTDGSRVKLYDIVSTTGLTEGQTYYVVNATADSFQVAATEGGSPIALTTNGTANLLNYKQAIVTVTPQVANSFTTINFQVRHTGASAVAYATGWLDILVSAPSLTTLTVGGSSTVRQSSLEQFQLISSNSVTSFANKFQDCVSLQSMPVLNTSAGTTFAEMFFGCRLLRVGPMLDTSSGTLFYGMFRDCTALVTISPIDTSGGTNFSSMFNGAFALENIPLIDTGMASNFSYMFYGCYALKSVPLFNTAAGTTFSSMFRDCRSLEAIPLFNTALGTAFDYMFYSCFALNTIPLLNTASGTNFSYMFGACYSLASVPPLNVSAGTTFTSMFTACPSLAVGALSGTAQAITYSSCNLSGAELNAIYTGLATVVGKTITVSGNYGISSDDPTIATAKGWTVSGS